MKRRAIPLCLLLMAMLALLTGCFFRSVDELYAVPEAPAEYWALQSKIKEIRDQGGEYIAPLTGEYIQSVQPRIWTVTAFRRPLPFSGSARKKSR